MRRSILVTLVVCALMGNSCGSDAKNVDETSSTTTPTSETLRVPADYPTIQKAVDAAAPGSMVLIAPGTYNEGVSVETDNVVIRGEDRNTVILSGLNKEENGFKVFSNGVAIENLTVTGYRSNGILFTGTPSEEKFLQGYRASYITAYNNGLYGLYAFAAQGGQFDHVYASGHPDSGLYIGQCKPCNAVITDSVAENNSAGYYGTNAGGDLYIINSVFRGNRLGITPNSQDYEKLAPQTDAVVAGNLVTDNNNMDAPQAALGVVGVGIAIGGGAKNMVTKNRVTGHVAVGILVSELDNFPPTNNTVQENVVTENGVDLAYTLKTPLLAEGNCFAANTFATSLPAGIETAFPCGAAPTGKPDTTLALPAPTPGIPYDQMPPPPAQTSMPDITVKAQPASAAKPNVNLDDIKVPNP